MIKYKFQTPDILKPKEIYQVHQVHSPDILLLSNQTQIECSQIKSDGLITNKNIQIGIQTADCVPILIYSENENYISAIHAGWKGVLTGIVSEGIQKFHNSKISSNQLKIMIGPHISNCCFEVSKDLFEQFQTRWDQFGYILKSNQKLGSTTKQTGDGLWINLKDLIYSELFAKGVHSSQIQDESECTYCTLGIDGQYKYASFRRYTHSKDKNPSYNQRQWSWIQKI